MKKFGMLLCIFSVLLFTNRIDAQEKTKEDSVPLNYLILWSGDSVACKKVSITTAGTIFCDSVKYERNGVRFVQDNVNLYANLKPFQKLNISPQFGSCFEHGRVNCFKPTIAMGYMNQHPDAGKADDALNKISISGSNSLLDPSSGKSRQRYYVKDMGELKRFKLKNLIPDLAEEDKSLTLIKKARKNKTASIVSLSSAGACALSAVFWFATGPNGDSGLHTGMGLISIVPILPLIGTAFVFAKVSESQTIRAVRIFNRYPAFKAKREAIRKKIYETEKK